MYNKIGNYFWLRIGTKYFIPDTPLYFLCLLIFLFNLIYPYIYIYSVCMIFGDGFPSGSPQIKDSARKGNQRDYSTAQKAKKAIQDE